MRRRAGMSIIAVLALGSCVPGPVAQGRVGPTTPRGLFNAAPTWRELTSAHFAFATDVGEDEARDIVDQMEELYELYRELLFPAPTPPPGRTRVVLFSRKAQYKEIFPATSTGSALASGGFDLEPTIVLSRGEEGEWRSVFKHELAHRFVFFHMPAAPLWFNEGLAQFIESMEVNPGHVRVGPMPPGVFFATRRQDFVRNGYIYQTIAMSDVPRVSTLRRLTQPQFYAQDSANAEGPDARQCRRLNYLGAQVGVATLRLGPPELRARYGRFQAGLGEATASGDAVFDAVYGDVPAARLEEAFVATMQTVPTATLDWTRTPRTTDAPVEHRVLSPAQANVLLARLALHWDSEALAPFTRGLLDEALQQEPGLVPALVAQGLLRLEEPWEAIPLARRALAINPRDASALHLYAELRLREERGRPKETQDWEDVTEAVARLQAAATLATQFEFLARYAQERRRGKGASALALRAIQADASCTQCYLTASSIAESEARWSEAATALRLALGSRGHSPAPQAWVDRLGELERRAGVRGKR